MPWRIRFALAALALFALVGDCYWQDPATGKPRTRRGAPVERRTAPAPAPPLPAAGHAPQGGAVPRVAPSS